MKFYRVDWYDWEPTAQQSDWATSKREAEKIARESGEDATVKEIDVPTDRAGLLAFLKDELWRPMSRPERQR